MAHLPVQCQNCGARYKIPETFKSDKAKCKACGTMIDVAAARDSSDADAAPKPAATPASGGTRKPRETGAASTRRSKSDGSEDKIKSPVGTRSSRRRSRAGADDDGEEGEGGGRRHYEKKKDNTPMIAGIVIVALAVVASVFWMVYDPGEDEKKEVAEKPVAKKDDGKSADVKVAEADAKKDAAAKAKAAAAKKKADAKKKLRPKTKRDQAIKADEEVKAPEDVFKPASVLKELPRPKGMSDEKFTEINDALDALKAGGGLAAIRAPKALRAAGVEMIPLATNKLLALDYTKFETNEYAYLLGKIIFEITEFGIGWEPVIAGEDVDPKVGNRNAGRVWDLHIMARGYWYSTEKFEAWQASRPKK